MKYCGTQILPYLSAFQKLGIITADERNELARLTGIAMMPGNEHFYGSLRKKLLEIERKQDGDRESSLLYEAINLLPVN